MVKFRAKHSPLTSDGETVGEFVFFMMAGKNNRCISNQSRILGYVVQPAKEIGPGGFRNPSTDAERTQGLVQKWHKSMHAHTHDGPLSRQATSHPGGKAG
uniref:PPUP58 n=1 Tax=Poeciliopsis prolifica TaxID=188132 RepID=A0A0S7ENK2_9TELE